MNGLDRFLSFMILSELNSIKDSIEKNIVNEKWWQETLQTLTNFLQRNETDPANCECL